MNDEEIKKVLECCGIEETCWECPLKNEVDCLDKLNHSLLDLINRQQAESERLKILCTSKDVIIKEQEAEIERLENAIIALMSYLDILGADKTDTSFINQATEFNKQIRADIKSEAIKEFAERLKMKAYLDNGLNGFLRSRVIDVNDIDNLLAERVGGMNGNSD